MAPETRQQLIALVLGIVFIVGFILFLYSLGQFLRNRRDQSQIASSNTTVSPTPTKKVDPKVSPSITPRVTTTPAVIANVRQPNVIPQTGAGIILIPTIVGAMSTGFFLLKQKPQ